ncbi:hypothetical protein PG990_007646 [Apiospora arundinis]
MTRIRSQPRANKPVMVMLHGSGSSGTIFGIQTHFIAKELSKNYHLVFLDAPTPSLPGPGVLPLFADMDGYYRWLTTTDSQASATMHLVELLNVARHIQTELDFQGINASRVEAMLGFSQGALVAMAMLGLGHMAQSPWENLRFCISIAAGASGNEKLLVGIQDMMSMLSRAVGREDGKFPAHIVHAAGMKDVWYRDGKCIANMCAPETSATVDYRDGHVVPRQKDDVTRLLRAIASVDQKSKQTITGMKDMPSASLDLLPSVLSGGEATPRLALLREHGWKEAV